VVFHIGTQVLMGIPFFGLWGCYVALFDWEWLLEPRPEGPAVPPRPPGRAWVLGVALTVAAAVQGARGAVQAWPFACYPTFQWMLGTEIPDVSMVAVLDDGRERRIPPRAKSQAGWATAWTVAGTMGRDPSPTTLRAYWDRAARDPKVAALAPREVHFFRAWYSVLPEDRGAPPRREEPIGTISVRP
jgi:hypothetical protein